MKTEPFPEKMYAQDVSEVIKLPARSSLGNPEALMNAPGFFHEKNQVTITIFFVYRLDMQWMIVDHFHLVKE